jgi:hypothetical protein
VDAWSSAPNSKSNNPTDGRVARVS